MASMDKKKQLLPQQDYLFATFMLNDLEFALEVKHLRDAIPAPRQIVSLPSSHPCVRGIIELRNRIIPILDTRQRFSLPPGTAADGGHVAITSCHGRLFGLLFDRIREVIRVKGATIELLAPEFQQEGELLAGIIKLDEGRRLVQIIDPLALFSGQDTSGGVEEAGMSGQSAGEEGSLQVVSFLTAGQLFALPVTCVREIITVPAISQRILVEGYIRGVIALRREFLSILDLRCFLTGEETVCSPDSRILVLHHQQSCFGLLVDGVREVICTRESDKLPMPPWTGSGHDEAFVGLLERQGGNVVLIDMPRLFAGAMERLAEHLALHGHGGESAATDTGSAREDSRQRRVYITFALDEVYGIPIEHIREIVPCLDNIKPVPGQIDVVAGLLTLRSEVIPILSLRRLLGRPDPRDNREALIMILTCRGRQLGVLIDRLLEIREVSLETEESVPRILAATTTGGGNGLVERVVKLTGRDGGGIPVILLDVPRCLEMLHGGQGGEAGSP